MKKIFLLLLFISHSLMSQIPDYSKLTRKEKNIFLYGYGYIKTISGDTIYSVIKGIQSKYVTTIHKGELIRLEYPRKLEKYKYLKEIPLSEIDMFYSVSYRIFKYVKKFNGNTIILNLIVDGKVKVYDRLVVGNSSYIMSNTYVNGMTGSGGGGIKEIYLENERGILYIIIGKDKYGDKITKQRAKYNFTEFFKGKYDKELIEKIKPRERKIIEFVEKYNVENG